MLSLRLPGQWGQDYNKAVALAQEVAALVGENMGQNPTVEDVQELVEKY